MSEQPAGAAVAPSFTEASVRDELAAAKDLDVSLPPPAIAQTRDFEPSPVHSPASVTSSLAEPEPRSAPALAPVAKPAQAPVAAVPLGLAPDSDLVMVETRFAPPPADDPDATASRPRRVRPPRVQVADEPLQIVETHKHDAM